LKAFPVPDPLHAPSAHPAHAAQSVPSGHCASAVHQQGTPAAAHLPLGDDTVSQLPSEHAKVTGVEVAVSQSSLSAVPVPVHAPALHWLFALTHLPLAQSASATHKHAVWALLRTGAGVRLVVQLEPDPVLAHATELGGGSHPCPSSVPVPVHEDALQCDGMQWPLSHATSEVQ
jgi:hypothetical protein